MTFEQISINNAVFDSPVLPVYENLDNNGRVYCKIDWLTVMFFDCSINNILTWLNLGSCVSDFLATVYEQSRGYDNVFKFSYNGILIETSSAAFYGQQLDLSIFDVICQKIRLELSGSALDYLRSCGIDFNEYRFVKPNLPDGGSYHFTRSDWAFDFINYKSYFVDRLIDHINKHRLPSDRVPLASTNGAISCKMVLGGQKTVYLGSSQSDRMLRVYDKRLQYINMNTGCYIKENPYQNPSSWFRIEWQTRNKFANSLVIGVDSNGVPSDFKSILKDIFIRYAFADGTFNNNHAQRPVVDFWNELLPWSDLETRIIQNANYVQPKSPEQRIIDSFESICMRNFIFYYSILGRDEVERRINLYLRSLSNVDPVSIRRSYVFNCKLNELQFSSNLNRSCSQGLWINLDRLHFSF